MSDITSFYDDLDFKYLELAICVDRIDRYDPGSPKFIIPVLTPTMSKTDEQIKTVYQNTANLLNGDISPEVSTISMSNTLTIPLPREICGGIDTKILDSLVSAINSLGGSANIDYSDRYIEKGSKWIVAFVGGDITNPKIIAPYEPLARASG